MSKPDFPYRIDVLTPSWLTAVLRENGALHGSKITGYTSEPLLDGYTASVFRLDLEYEAKDKGAPKSLVIKFHRDSEAIRSYFEHQRIYEREVRFYQKLARTRSLPVPTCHAAEFDDESGEFVLLLEDLSAARPGDWELDPIGDIRFALEKLAQLHAGFWGDPLLQQYDWIVDTSDCHNPPPYRELWNEKLEQVRVLYRDQIAASVWTACDQWRDHWDDIMRCMSTDTHTLVHTDVHLEQIFFPTEALPRFALFDWQNPTKGWAAEDVIHPIVCDLDIEDRRVHEAGLINHYYDQLCQHGVRDLTRERFWFQCNLSLLWVYFMFFTMLSQEDMRLKLLAEIEEAGDDLAEWIFDPLAAVTEDWQLSKIIEQAVAEARSAVPG